MIRQHQPILVPQLKRAIKKGITTKIRIHSLVERNFPRTNWEDCHDDGKSNYGVGKTTPERMNGMEKKGGRRSERSPTRKSFRV
jgi:hypothetical protein